MGIVGYFGGKLLAASVLVSLIVVFLIFGYLMKKVMRMEKKAVPMKLSSLRKKNRRLIMIPEKGVKVDIEIITNEMILEKLEEKCKEVEFVGEVEPVKAESAIRSIEAQQKEIDGVLVFGHPPGELTSIGLPMVATYPLWGQNLFRYHKKKWLKK